MSARRCLAFLLPLAIALAANAMAAAQQPLAPQDQPANTTTKQIQSADPEQEEELTIEEIRSLLNAIDPYLPKVDVATEIDIFGSTGMDALAHNWAHGFRKYHQSAEVKIAASGSESVFEYFEKHPSSIGMLSRPIDEADIQRLKELGMKRPVALLVARGALGVFVNEANPLEAISYSQLSALFCAENPNDTTNWKTAGLEGDWANQPVHVIGRDEESGTRRFVDKYLFHQLKLRNQTKVVAKNGDIARAVGEDPLAIGIADFKFHPQGTRRLKLRTETGLVSGNDHEVLLGHYPMTRPMCLVLDAGDESKQGKANIEFVRFVLAREGQTGSILVGLYPYDPPTLRAQLAKLGPTSSQE